MFLPIAAAAVSETSPIDIHSMLPALVVVTVIVVLLMGGGGFYFFIIRPRSNPAGLNRLYTEGVSPNQFGCFVYSMLRTSFVFL